MARPVRLWVALVAAAGSVLLTSCGELSLKALIRQNVEEYKDSLVPGPRVALFDGTTQISDDGSRPWTGVMLGGNDSKTFTIRNDGNLVLNLTATPVAETGGAGAIDFNVASQPATLVLDPGETTSFTIDFSPTTADADLPCSFVITSDDPVHGSFGFTLAGHSTQWHGRKWLVQSTNGNVWNPQLAIYSGTLFLTYLAPAADLNAIGVKSSVDGGWTWSTFGGGQVATAPYPHVLQVGNGEPHIFFHDSSATEVRYTKWLNSAWRNNIYPRSASSIDANGLLNGSMLLSGMVFLAWYDNSTSSLWYNFSINPFWQTPPGQVISSFTSPVQLTGGSTGRAGGTCPSMARDSSGNLYILYADPSNNRPMLIYTTSSNLNFASAPGVYNGPAISGITGTSLALTESGGVVTVHAVCSGSAPIRQLYYASTTSSDLSSWSSPLNLNINTRDGKNFKIVADANGKLYLLNQSRAGTTGMVLSTSTDGGLGWSQQTIDNDAAFSDGTFSSSVALAVSGQTVYTTYSTASTHSNGRSITLKKSIDGGLTW